MARTYGKIQSSIWEDAAFRELSPELQRLMFYLITSRHGNIIGCFRIPSAYVQEDTGWRSKTVMEGFANLSKNGWILRDEPTQWVLIKRFLEWEPLQNKNQAIGAIKLFVDVPTVFRKTLYEAVRKHCVTVEWPSGNGLQTLCIPMPTIEQEQEQEQSPSQRVGSREVGVTRVGTHTREHTGTHEADDVWRHPDDRGLPQ